MNGETYEEISGVASATESGRLDQLVAAAFPMISRRSARKLIAENRVVVDGHPLAVASRTVRANSRIAIVPVETLPVIAVTNEWIAVSKPPFVPTQSAPTLAVPSVQERVASTLKQQGSASELFVVHRLDANTSGVLVLARTAKAAAGLSESFAAREMTKIYLAVVHGSIVGPMTIDAPIGRSGPTRFDVRDDGLPAVTLVDPVSSTEMYSSIETRILTGRTHQIRVHLAWRGHPVAGDRKYGRSADSSDPARPMLHAARLEHPRLGVLSADLPDDIVKFMREVGLS